jgi:hypothetical protein
MFVLYQMAQSAAIIFYGGLEGHHLLNRSGQGFYRDDMVTIFRKLQSLGYNLYVADATGAEQVVIKSRIPKDIDITFSLPELGNLPSASFAVSNIHDEHSLPIGAIYTYDQVFTKKVQPTPEELIEQLATGLGNTADKVYLIGTGYKNSISIDNLGLNESGNFINARPGEVEAAGQLAIKHAEINGVNGVIDVVYTDAYYDARDMATVGVMHNINYYPEYPVGT